MKTTYTSEAFHQICKEAKPAKSHHVSLYANEPFYGGPEEGGWWGSDTVLERMTLSASSTCAYSFGGSPAPQKMQYWSRWPGYPLQDGQRRTRPTN